MKSNCTCKIIRDANNVVSARELHKHKLWLFLFKNVLPLIDPKQQRVANIFDEVDVDTPQEESSVYSIKNPRNEDVALKPWPIGLSMKLQDRLRQSGRLEARARLTS